MNLVLVCFLSSLLVAGGTAVPYVKDKITFYPKPTSSMLKPLLASDKYQTKPLSRSTLSVDQSTMWLVTWYYSYGPDNFCNSQIIMKKGVPSGQCLAFADNTYGSYDCSSASNGYCYYSAFYDAACTNPNGSPSQVYLGMCELGDASSDGYLADDGVNFLSQLLTIEWGFPVALPGDSTTFTTYSSTNCDQSTMTSYTLSYANMCYSQYNGMSYTSSKYVNPYLYTYSTNNCDEINGYYPYYNPPGVCEMVYFTTPYTTGMIVLNQPTSLPTPTPTFSPTSSPSTPAGPVVNTATVVGAAVGGFAALALLDTMLYLFAPVASQTDDLMPESQQTGEF